MPACLKSGVVSSWNWIIPTTRPSRSTVSTTVSSSSPAAFSASPATAMFGHQRATSGSSPISTRRPKSRSASGRSTDPVPLERRCASPWPSAYRETTGAWPQGVG